MAAIIQLDPKRYGATLDEWATFTLILGLDEDLLPVVSNPNAKISENSKIQKLGKTPSIYNSYRRVVGMPDWTEQKTTAHQITSWSSEKDYGICVQTRRVRALDVDVTDKALADELLRFIQSTLGVQLPMRVRNNSTKFLLCFDLPSPEEDLAKRTIKTQHGIIEFLATGQQFVAAGTHESGERYEWINIDQGIPQLATRSRFEHLWDALQNRFGIEPSTEARSGSRIQKRAEAISSDPVAQFLNEKSLILGSERSGQLHITCPFAEHHTSAAIMSATSYFPAHTGGYERGHFRCLHAHCEGRSDREFLDALGFVDGGIDDFDIVVDEPATDGDKKANRFPVVQMNDFMTRPQPKWIVKGIVPRAELMVIFGESGSGKTFAALDLVMCIARGEPWRAFKSESGKVVYIAAEGAGGFRNRLVAYACAHALEAGFTRNLPFGVIAGAPNLLQKDDAVDVAKSMLASMGKIDVVVVDTFAQVTAGGNENSGEDVGKALAHCKGIHKATGALVILIHHSGKDSSKGARGWSGLRAAADAELEVVRLPTGRKLRMSKQKDGEDGLEFGFQLETVTIGTDEDNAPITSCVVREAQLPAVSSAGEYKPGPVEQMVIDVLTERSKGQLAGIEVEHVVDEVATRIPKPVDGKRDTRKQRARRSIEKLCSMEQYPYDLQDGCIEIL